MASIVIHRVDTQAIPPLAVIYDAPGDCLHIWCETLANLRKQGFVVYEDLEGKYATATGGDIELEVYIEQ
ncbi:MAG: hypothetical protein EBR82_51035 [Caulobacteraceae bacterium]|nr:hypothetical protein [Caulobacteraceae bacterium]